MTTLKVSRLPNTDNGRLLVRLNIKYRKGTGIDRYGLARITNINTDDKISSVALILGHDEQNAIFMPLDIRRALKLEKGDDLEFTLKKLGWWGNFSGM